MESQIKGEHNINLFECFPLKIPVSVPGLNVNKLNF